MRGKNQRRILTCHMCSVHEGFGRVIEVVGIYSICNWCYWNILPQFAAAFEDIKLEDPDRIEDSPPETSL